MNSNSVMHQKQGKKNIYYLPGYLRVKVKNFTEMSLGDLSARMNATIIFTVFYGDIQDKIVEKLKTQIIFLFGRDDAIKLKSQDNLEIKLSNNEKKQQLQFTIRKILNLRIQSEVFWSPFQIINLILTITVQPVTIQKNIVKINLMDIDDPNDSQKKFMKLSYSDEGTFGNYNLASALMKARYSNQRVYKVQDQQKYQKMAVQEPKVKNKIQHFQYAHFKIPLYKYPMVALATIFLPLFLLGIISLGVFFQTQNISNRIQNLSALAISFVALIPTIRQQIPPNPKIVFIQILVYFNSLTSFLALIHTLHIRYTPQGEFNLIWYQSGLFIVSAIITFGVILIVIIMMILHYLLWLPSYVNQTYDDTNVKFKRTEWHNIECDKYFEKWSKMKQILQISLKSNIKQQGASMKLLENMINLKPQQIKEDHK